MQMKKVWLHLLSHERGVSACESVSLVFQMGVDSYLERIGKKENRWICRYKRP
jgi:hypothetical protein